MGIKAPGQQDRWEDMSEVAQAYHMMFNTIYRHDEWKRQVELAGAKAQYI